MFKEIKRFGIYDTGMSFLKTTINVSQNKKCF